MSLIYLVGVSTKEDFTPACVCSSNYNTDCESLLQNEFSIFVEWGSWNIIKRQKTAMSSCNRNKRLETKPKEVLFSGETS